jgi:2-succinyl-6-hydroxy-2,4-cyclohexadiene-1-carboxylate synthase
VTTTHRSAGGVELPVLEAGAGGRPLLLVHGFTGVGRDFADHIDALAADGWHVVAPTQRGHHRSAALADEAAYSLATYADDLLALADGLGWDRFVLLGHSMGGMVAQVLALEAPERLEALVLMDTGHGPVALDVELVATGVGIARSAGMDALADAMNVAGASPLETPAAVRLREERPDLVPVWDAQLRGCDPAMYAAMATEMVNQEDRLDALRSLQVPTLVIVGEQDGPFVGASRRMAEAIAGARLEVIADAGHSPQMETPAAWAEVLHGFLASLPVASR